MASAKEPLSISHPEIAAQAVGWDPSTVTHGSGAVRLWRCQVGHDFENSPHLRTGQNQGCPVCSNKKVLKGFNDLATTHPEIAAQADGWDPTRFSAGSGKKLPWKCEFAHQWNAVAANRARGSGCPFCAGKMAISGENDLATTHPELAAQADGWDPTKYQAGSHAIVNWTCEIGHDYLARIYNKTKLNPTGCPYCSGKKVLKGFNDLATTHPEIAAQADGWDTTRFSSGSNKEKNWCCPSGHQWVAMINTRTKGVGCPVCTNKKVLIGYNDLVTVNPKLAAQAFEWDPTTVTQSSRKRRKWQCQLGHTWISIISDRTRGNGCPTCSISGFDPNRDAWLYLVTHDEWEMLQIGITTQPNIRLASHGRIGWRLIELRGPLEGHHIQELENSLLKSLKQRGATFANHLGGEIFDGWTEAWTKDSLAVTSFKQLLDWVYEDEQ